MNKTLIVCAIIAFCQLNLSNLYAEQKTPDINKLLGNSARTDLIGREMWNWAALPNKTGDAQRPDTRNQDYGISQLPNAMWAPPKMGLTGRWCYGVQTKLSDVVKVQITQTKQSHQIPLDFVPTRNEWTPACLSTYFRALPDTLKGSYPHAGDLTIKETKCITENNVLILEYTLTHDNRTVGDYSIELLFPAFKKLAQANQFSFSTITDARAMGKTLPVEGFVSVCNSENTINKCTVHLNPFESKKIRFAVAFDSNSLETAAGEATKICKNPTVCADQISRFNAWFSKNVPLLKIENQDMLKLYYYRWFVACRNYHNPSKYIKNHPYKTPVFYESPFGSWFGSTVGLSIPLHVSDVKWAKSPEMAENDLLNWRTQGKLYDNYIQFTPKSAWDLYLHYPDKPFLDSIYSSVQQFSNGDIDKKNKAILPVQTGSWPTGAEYQPSFYEFTPEKWDWRQDYEGKKLYGTKMTSIVRLDKAMFTIANSYATSNMAKVLNKKADALYFKESAEQMLTTIKTRHWDEKSGFDKFFDPAWFWSDFPLASVSKTCPMYWSGNCITGPAQSSLEKPHDYDCSWNGPTWHFTNGFMCEALGSAALTAGTEEMKLKWLDFFNKWADLHYAYGDKSVPCVIEHNRPTDGARFRSYVDYFHSSWIDPFMKFYLGIQIDDNGNFSFNPFTTEEFEIKDVSIMGKKYSFSQQLIENKLIQSVFDSKNKLIKTTVKPSK